MRAGTDQLVIEAETHITNAESLDSTATNSSQSTSFAHASACRPRAMRIIQT